MATQRTLTLTKRQRQELEDHRDHYPAAYVRERCSALLQVAAKRRVVSPGRAS